MIRKYILSIIFLFVAGSAYAEWQLVDDFEDGDSEGWIVTEELPGAEASEVRVIDDPTGSGQGKVGQFFPGMPVEGVHRTTFSFALPEATKILDKFPDPTNTSTLYLKVMQPLVDGVPGVTNATFGMASAEFLDKPLDEWSWGDYSVLARINSNIMDQHSGSGYVQLDITEADPPDAVPVSNTFYEYWFVIDRNTQTIDGYIKGGQWAEQSKVWEGSQHRTNPSGAPLDTMYMRSANNGIEWVDALHYDDIYIDNSGTANLTSPVEGGGGGPSEPNDLINISTRGLVGLGGEIMIAGFVSAGDAASGTVLIRGIGPTLGGFGVANTVEDPVLTVFRTEADGSSTQIAMNDDWGDSQAIADAAAAVGAFALDAGSMDAAILLSGLTPGAYTVQLSGKGTTSQNGLIEVYRVD